ncbi:MAG: hypothetical protein N0E48_19240 [Candidatus Thiodiazotropha endolucinida]|nr:hypothetical protein [Candidatus Thiodiazotropha taylori]MCW4345472.1 hypothetical protein [Candidatus Thiodiazotropha endolucinida]
MAMAPKEPLSTKEPKLIKLIWENTARRKLNGPSTIVRDLLNCWDATNAMRIEALADQALLDQQLGSQGWLHRVSVEADNWQFFSRKWISQHIRHLERQGK